MNVKDLIAQLERFNPNESVFIASDEEGNDFKAIDVSMLVTASDGFQTASGSPVAGVVIMPRG